MGLERGEMKEKEEQREGCGVKTEQIPGGKAKG